MVPRLTPKAKLLPEITSYHDDYNVSKASANPPAPVVDATKPASLDDVPNKENIGTNYDPTTLMHQRPGDWERDAKRRPKSAAAASGTRPYLREFAPLQSRQEDCREEERMPLRPLSAENRFPRRSGRADGGGKEMILVSGRSVASSSDAEHQYQAREPSKKPAFADYPQKDLAKLSRSERHEYREYWRRMGRIPTTNDFPYRACLGWDAQKPRRPPQFT